MKKTMLAAIAVFGLTLANAQTNNTNITTNSGNSKGFSTRPTVEVRAERSAMRLKDELKLDDAQFKKVYEAKLAAYTKIEESQMKNRADKAGEAHKADKKAAHADYMKAMKGILTADQQTTWEKSNSVRYERWKTAATAQPAAKPDFEDQKMRMEME